MRVKLRDNDAINQALFETAKLAGLVLLFWLDYNHISILY